MAIIDALPNRPLKRAEVDSLTESDRIHGVFPVYGDRESTWDTAFVVVLTTDSGASSIAYTDEGWEIVEQRNIGNEHGISWDDEDEMKEMQKIGVHRANEE